MFSLKHCGTSQLTKGQATSNVAPYNNKKFRAVAKLAVMSLIGSLEGDTQNVHPVGLPIQILPMGSFSRYVR